jgi:dihydroorotase/N-acyl-D-amino-acid deacylase
MAAQRLRLKDRGVLREGLAADVTIFDPATVRDESTFPDPHRYPTGLPYVIVNGAVVVDRGHMSAERAGRILRRPR